MIESIEDLIRLGEDSVREFKSIRIQGKRVAEPDAREISVAHVRRQIGNLLSWRAAKLNVIGRNRRATVCQKRTYLHMPFKMSRQEALC